LTAMFSFSKKFHNLVHLFTDLSWNQRVSTFCSFMSKFSVLMSLLYTVKQLF